MSVAGFFSYQENADRGVAGFLASWSEGEIATVLSYTQARSYEPGEIAIRYGDTDRSLYLITSGRFEVLVPGKRGPLRACFIERGEVVGELAFFDGQPRAAEVRAVTRSEALIMTNLGFDRLRLMEPRLAINFVLDLGSNLSVQYRIYSKRLAALGKV